jgi:predicted nucleotidyltransferase component of viral defense system
MKNTAFTPPGKTSSLTSGKPAGKKRVLGAQELFDLRATLQGATIAALLDSRRWEPGEIAFQGGTCLHLAHGSVRFSEDLDFLIRGGLSLSALAQAVKQRLRLPSSVASDLQVFVEPGRDERNPHQFDVVLRSDAVIGSARVKVELWQTPADALKALQIKVCTVRHPAGQAFVPSLTLQEVFADKVFALGARSRIKARDIFDLWWLQSQERVEPRVEASALRTRLRIYPAPSGQEIDALARWLDGAQARQSDLRSESALKVIQADLKRWLPSHWDLSDAAVSGMLERSDGALAQGIEVMRQLESELERESGVQAERDDAHTGHAAAHDAAHDADWGLFDEPDPIDQELAFEQSPDAIEAQDSVDSQEDALAQECEQACDEDMAGHDE